MKLKFNETKTRRLDSRWERFVFLGFEFARFRSPRTRTEYVHVQPSLKARLGLREEVRKVLNCWTRHQSCAETVRKLNRIIQGWSKYYCHWHCVKVFSSEQRWVQNRLRRWLWRKYGRKHALFGFFTNDRIHGQYKLWRMPVKSTWN